MDLDKTRNPGRIYSDLVVFGTSAPKLVSSEEICPPAICPVNCTEFKCKDSMVNLYDLVKHFEMKPFEGTRYVGLQNRTLGKKKPSAHKLFPIYTISTFFLNIFFFYFILRLHAVCCRKTSLS